MELALQYNQGWVQLQPVTSHSGVQPVLKAGGTHGFKKRMQGDGAARMLSNSFGPVYGGSCPSSLGSRQSQCPAKHGGVFKVTRNVVKAVPFGLHGVPVLHV